MAPQTRAAFEARWGPNGSERVEEIPAGDLLDTAWARRSDWAIIPFEEIQPRWKVLQVDGMRPTDRGLNIDDYPLTIWFGISGSPEALRLLAEKQETAHPYSRRRTLTPER
jgi:poly-gamma-glutamate synthesis protein (capsule biosynthesis protein)